MTKFDVVVDKLVYRNKTTNYTVFKGTVLTWMKRKKEFRPTKETYTFVGFFFCIFEGDRFAVEGDGCFHPIYGSQIQVKNSTRSNPVTELEIRAFLKKSIKGMTPALADKIMNRYGLDAIESLRRDPHAYDFLGLSQDATDELCSALMQNAMFEETLLFLQVNGLDCRYAMDLHKKYGGTVVRVLHDNPYIPYIDSIFDFKTADKLYLDLGNPRNTPKRCEYAVLASIQMDSANNGNVFLRRSFLERKMTKFLADTSKKQGECCFPFSQQDIDNALVHLENEGFLICESRNGEECIYLKDNYFDEKKIAACLNGYMSRPKRISYRQGDIDQFLANYQQIHRLTLAAEQTEAVKKAFTSPVSIISGGPGTGKTLTINTIMSAIHELSPNAVVKACAPTGKAAVRISELTGSPASTIHRMLKIGQFQEEIRGGALECDFLFVDEFSMVDIQLCAKLFDAVNDCGRIVIVGDYNQLPSVGPGLVLRDMIACKAVPATFLKHVFRQENESLIALNADRIINRSSGQDPVIVTSQTPGGDFYFIEESDPRKIADIIQSSILRAKTAYGYSLETLQVLSPVRFGDMGVDNLNYMLQKSLNPNPVFAEFEDKKFCLGDKVIHTKNDYDLEVFNGEVGFITNISFQKDRYLQVAYPDRDVWYPQSSLAELDLAYALTAHKLQGSEYPVIIMPVHELQGVSLSKNLIYTALTRAKKMVILIGSMNAFKTGLRRETTIERESNLVSRILERLPPLLDAA